MKLKVVGSLLKHELLRKKLDLKKGEKLVIIEEEGYIKIIPPADLTSLCGAWSDLDTKTVRKQIEDMRKEERF
ncbi:MAG: hypothetical protein SCH39_02615 [Methanosarcinales archaeon]|nr:hypothetical protein [Methanosarcinales archaeon]